uniref:Protein S100 n=1 Tax=Oreochromis niloticus TaxID=8128 RepID=A0A669CCQ9_ORENI
MSLARSLHKTGLICFFQQFLRERHEPSVFQQATSLRHLSSQCLASFLLCPLQSLALIMSDIQTAMALLIKAFHTYSGKEGDKLTLSKGELKELLQKELGDIFGKTSDKAAIDKIFNDLDANADGTVDFQEYVTLVACLTMLCNEFFTKK